MTSLLFALAILAAVAVVGRRKWHAYAAERRRPGSRVETAIPVTDFRDIDLTIASQRCFCGGSFENLGEGPAGDVQHPLRVVHLECRRCERRCRTYFDMSTLRH